ncbi:unnamed protein product, partial [marine sediment metagenome]
TERIIGIGADTPKEIKLSFGDREIQNVYRTKLTFLNNGTDIIDKQDIVSPLQFELNNSEILIEPIIISKSRDEIRFSATRNVEKNSVLLGFEYLDNKDGGMIEIIHTEYEELKIHHNIKGAKKIENIDIDKQNIRYTKRRNRIALFGAFLAYVIGPGMYYLTKSISAAVISALVWIIIITAIGALTDKTFDVPEWVDRKNKESRTTLGYLKDLVKGSFKF